MGSSPQPIVTADVSEIVSKSNWRTYIFMVIELILWTFVGTAFSSLGFFSIKLWPDQKTFPILSISASFFFALWSLVFSFTDSIKILRQSTISIQQWLQYLKMQLIFHGILTAINIVLYIITMTSGIYVDDAEQQKYADKLILLNLIPIALTLINLAMKVFNLFKQKKQFVQVALLLEVESRNLALRFSGDISSFAFLVIKGSVADLYIKNWQAFASWDNGLTAEVKQNLRDRGLDGNAVYA